MTGHNSSDQYSRHVGLREADLRQTYGDMAGLPVDDLRDRARQMGFDLPSYLSREELVVAISGGGYVPRRG